MQIATLSLCKKAAKKDISYQRVYAPLHLNLIHHFPFHGSMNQPDIMRITQIRPPALLTSPVQPNKSVRRLKSKRSEMNLMASWSCAQLVYWRNWITGELTKSEKILRVELSDIQLDYYKNILTRNYEALNEGGNGQKQSLLNIVMELKKASNHALMFPNAEAKYIQEGATKDEKLKALITTSGKMMLLDQLLTKMKKDNHRVLIFSQMVKMLDILGDYLHLRGYQFQRLDGTIPSAAHQQLGFRRTLRIDQCKLSQITFDSLLVIPGLFLVHFLCMYVHRSPRPQ